MSVILWTGKRGPPSRPVRAVARRMSVCEVGLHWRPHVQKHLSNVFFIALAAAMIVSGISWAQVAPGLTSRLSCGCVDSQDGTASYDIELRSEVKRRTQAWQYRYILTNKENRDLTILAYLVQGDRVEFVSSLMTDPLKTAEVPNGK